MTTETCTRIDKMRQQISDFDARICNTLIEFKQFAQDSGKNTNLKVQQIFARQLRTVRSLGIENSQVITRVFKTPFLLHMCYSQLGEDVKALENLINAAKLELQRSGKNQNAE